MSEKRGNAFNKGLFLDSGKANQPENTYSFALNAVNQDEDGFIGFLSNERGFTKKLDLSIIGATAQVLIGAVPLNDDDFVLFLADPTQADSEIWYVDKSYTATRLIYDGTWVPTASLNFKVTNQIQGTYRIDSKNHRIVYFTDNLNPPKHIDVDTVLSYLPTAYYIDPLQMNIFSEMDYPLMEYAYTKDTGGTAVETGMYQFAVRYLDDNLNPTNWSTPTMPVPVILEDYFGPAIYDIDSTGSGGISPVLTTKTLTYVLSNLDTRYKFYEVAVIFTKLGDSKAYIVDREAISGSTDEYTFKGINSTHPSIDVEEIITPFASYSRAKTIVQKGNRLLMGNLLGREIYNYQPYANNIQVNYVTFKVRAGETTDALLQSYKYGTGYFYWKSFMRDEVYSIGICFLYRDGTYSPVYHIPGRAADFKQEGDGTPTPFAAIDDGYTTNKEDAYANPNLRYTFLDATAFPVNLNVWDTYTGSADADNNDPEANGANIPLWKVANTACRLDVDDTVTPSDPGIGYFVHSYGQLGYWESEDLYPGDTDIWGSLAAQPIRHHKMPDTCVEPIFMDDDHPDAVASGVNSDTEYFYPMALMFSNIVVPPDLQEQIQGIKIVVTPRDIESNKSIVAKGVFFHTQSVSPGASTWGTVLDEFGTGNDYLVQNYPFNALNNNNGAFYNVMSNKNLTLDSKTLAFNSADTMFLKPFIQDVKFVRVEGVYQANITSPTLGNLSNRTDRQYLSIFTTAATTSEVTLNATALGANSSGNFSANIGFTYTWKNTTACTYPPGENEYLYNRSINDGGITYIGGGQKISSGTLYLPSGVDGFSNRGQQECIVFTIQQADPFYATEITADATGPTYGIIGLDSYSDPTSRWNWSAAIYYGSIKKLNKNQYNTVHDLTYRDTGCLLLNPTYDPTTSVVLESSFLNSDPTTIRDTTTRELIPQLICFGDTFINKVAFKRTFDYSLLGGFNPGAPLLIKPEEEGHTYWYWGEHSLINSDLRGTISTATNTSYWPHIVSGWGATEYIRSGPYVYNPTSLFLPDYNIDNRLYSFVIFPETYDPDFEYGRYITRIIWSEPTVKEEITDNYRRYLANSYYDVQKNRGELWNLAVKDDVLFAHCQDSIFRTFTNEQAIQTDASNTYIGTGEFFSVDPRELVTLENGGYAGTVSQWACISTPYGYIYPDVRRTSVMRLGEGLQDIGDIGLSAWFNKNMPIFLKQQLDELCVQNGFTWRYQDSDNPASPTGTGYVAVYDNKFARYILTKKDYKLTAAGISAFANGDGNSAGVGVTYPKLWYDDSLGSFVYKPNAITPSSSVDFSDSNLFESKSWTISFSFLTNTWISWHSYLPTFAFNVRNRIFSMNSLENGFIYEHDTEGNNFGKFYSVDPGTGLQNVYPFIVEFTNAEYPADVKVFDSLEVHLETFRLDGYGNWVNAGEGSYSAVPPDQAEPFFNTIWTYNSYQSSAEVTLTYNVNAKRRERVWRVSDLRDMSVSPYVTHERSDWAYSFYRDYFTNGGYIDKVPNNSNINVNKLWYEKERFRDKYITFRLYYNNYRGVDQAGNLLPGDKFVLKFVNTLFRLSPR